MAHQQTMSIIDDEDDVHFKKIPDSLADIQNELRQGGNGNDRQMNSLQIAEKSGLHRRPTNRAMILLLGESGSGKSSTINHLFGNTYAKTSDSESCTRETTEWFIESNVDEFLIKNLKLSIVDTPGFMDTNGFEQDSMNMACIKNFFETYPSSQNNAIFPNFILLVVNAGSNRYIGRESNFTKSLKALSAIGVVDRDNPNVLIVITHALYAGKNGEIFHKKNQKLGDDLADLCSIFLGVKPSYVFLENDHLTHELPKVEGKDWLTVLPNQTEQPANLFKALKELAGDGDRIGKLAISHFLRVIQEKDLTKGYCVNAESVSSSTEILQIFEEPCQISELEQFASLYLKLEPQYDNNEIMKLTDALHNKGIDLEKCKNMNIDDILSKVYPTLLNSNQKRFLEEGLRIKSKNFKKLNLSLGHSYDIFNDCKFQKSVYQLPEDNSCFSHNFEFPNNISVYPESKTHINAEILETKEDYVQQRLTQLKVQLDNYRSSQFTFAQRPKVGFNYKNKSRFTFSVQSSLFSLKLSQNKKVVTEGFKKDVELLPKIYKKGDQENADRFLSFFRSWGHYVIVEQKIGGSFESSIQNGTNFTNEQIRKTITAKLLSVFNGEVKMDSNKCASLVDMQSTLNWVGGNRLNHVAAFDQINHEQWMEWEKSLSKESVALDSYQLEPIHEAVKLIDQTKGVEVEKAFKDLMQINLSVEIGPTRSDTGQESVKNMWRYMKVAGIGISIGLGIGAGIGSVYMAAPHVGAFVTTISPALGEYIKTELTSAVIKWAPTAAVNMYSAAKKIIND